MESNINQKLLAESYDIALRLEEARERELFCINILIRRLEQKSNSDLQSLATIQTLITCRKTSYGI